MTEPRWALVVGASRGLGLGLAAELKRRGWNVVATVRDAGGEQRVEALSAKPGGDIQIERLDINDDAGIAALRRRLGDKTFDPIFDELNRRNAVVYTHPLEAACCKNPLTGVTAQTLEYPTDTTRIIMNLIVSNTATRCPNIKFVFSHAGGTLVSIAQRFLGNQVTADGLSKAPDPDSRLYHVRRFYYDTAGSANPIQIQSLKLLVPVSQLVFGTDFPFGNVSATATGMQSSGLSAAELRGVYRENALKFLPKYA